MERTKVITKIVAGLDVPRPRPHCPKPFQLELKSLLAQCQEDGCEGAMGKLDSTSVLYKVLTNVISP